MWLSSYIGARPFSRKPSWWGWFVCLLGAVFYAYEYFLRITPSVMSHEIMGFFKLNATQFGTLVAVYYFAYVPMQLPVGVMMDRFGPRRLLTVACGVCVVGVYLFSITAHFSVALLGRVLVGFGSAFAFIGVMKLATIWLPAERFALIAGLVSALGTVSGIVGDVGITQLVDRIGWNNTSQLSAILGILLTLIIWVVIRDIKSTSAKEKPLITVDIRGVLKGLWAIMTNRQIWITGTVGCLIYLPTTAFAESWGVAYLEGAYHLTNMEAATGTSLLFLGFTIGAPLVGVFSDKYRIRIYPLAIGGGIATVLMGIILFSPVVLSKHVVFILLFGVGLSYSVQPLIFVIAKESSPESLGGSAIAVMNAMVMLGGVIAPELIGGLLDINWDNQWAGGVRFYSEAAYRTALTIIPVGLLASVLLTRFIRHRDRLS